MNADAPLAALIALAELVRVNGDTEAEVGRRLGFVRQNWHNYRSRIRPATWDLVFHALATSRLEASFVVYGGEWFLRRT